MKSSELSHQSSGRGLLAGIDPRIKLLIFALLLAAVFSAQAIWRLLVLSLLAGVFFFLVPVFAGRMWLRLARLRWLFGATVILHLLFGNGHTLFGLSWLSRDGLMQGTVVVWQLVLAVSFASLLCWSSAPESLVAGGLGLMRPLKRLPLRTLGRHLLLVLYWTPVLQEEVLAAWQQHRPVFQVRQDRGWGVLWRHSTGLLADLMGRLVAKVEGMTDAMTEGELSIEPPVLPPLLCCGLKDRLTLLLVGAAAAVWFGMLP